MNSGEFIPLAFTGRQVPAMRNLSPHIMVRRQRGQSLVVAIVVMFVLLFIGGVFVGIVARNLLNSGRATQTDASTQFAESGIKYCDYFLMNSPDGADWRPTTTPVGQLNPNDPDFQWLSQGYARVLLPGGRALVRVTYGTTVSNNQLNPLGKYIKIESVGRTGNIDPNDPTTYLNSPPPRLRREYVAYKAIGITDYLRFITNRYNDTKFQAFLGVQPFGIPVTLQLGGLPQQPFGQQLPAWVQDPGAPIKSNGNLQIGYNTVIAADPRENDQIQVAGDVSGPPDEQAAILAGNTPPTNDPTRFPAVFSDLSQNPANADPASLVTNWLIYPSASNKFTTYNGLFLDGSSSPDPTGHARGIVREEPPILDTPDAATGITRYRALTRGSGKFVTVQVNGQPQQVDLGRIGLGTGMYIDNFGNVEPESQSVSGGQSLRSIWMNPSGGYSRWNGPYYVPPGASIEFGYPIAQYRDYQTNNPGDFRPLPGFRVARDAGDSANYFRDLQGNRLSNTTLDFTYFIYKPANQPPVLKIETQFYRDALKAALNTDDAGVDKFLPEFAGVIYAEGNLRVRGLLADSTNIPIRREAGDNDNLTDAQLRTMVHPALTVVSGSNIYIENSIVRETARCMLALLAVQNVVVNTTMFVAPNKGDLAFTATGEDNIAPFHANISMAEADKTPSFSLDFLFGQDPTTYVDPNGNKVPIYLLLRHGVEGSSGSGQTFLNLFINEWAPRRDAQNNALFNPFYLFPAQPPQPGFLPNQTYPIDQVLAANGHQRLDATHFENREFQIWPEPPGADQSQLQQFRTPRYLFTGALNPQTNAPAYPWPQGLKNTIRPAVDTSYIQQTGVSDYLLSRAAVAPMDIRIEAVIYAQNGSFFIIPGYPLNNNAQDSRDQDIRNALAFNANAPAGSMGRPEGYSNYFPFYNEPADCRITIVGAVAENRTASPADQSAWFQVWGWIPEALGSTGHDVYNNGAQAEQSIPLQHLRVNDDTTANGLDMRTNAEKTFTGPGQAQEYHGITRGIRFLYDPALLAPYAGYNPANAPFRNDYVQTGNANRTWAQGRTLPPMPRLPVCPGFLFNGEVR